MSEAILIRKPESVQELRIVRKRDSVHAEIIITIDGMREMILFTNPDPLQALIELFQGIDNLQVFDRNCEDGFHHDFGRFRIECLVDEDCHSFDADEVNVATVQ